MSCPDFDLDALRVVLGVMHLAGEPQESQHNSYSLDKIADYTQEGFRKFVLNLVEDLVNRAFTIVQAYKKARQGYNQIA